MFVITCSSGSSDVAPALPFSLVPLSCMYIHVVIALLMGLSYELIHPVIYILHVNFQGIDKFIERDTEEARLSKGVYPRPLHIIEGPLMKVYTVLQSRAYLHTYANDSHETLCSLYKPTLLCLHHPQGIHVVIGGVWQFACCE